MTRAAFAFAFSVALTLDHARARTELPSTTTGLGFGQLPVMGGRVSGPMLNADVLAGGADNPTIRADGYVLFDASYLLETDDGVRLRFINRGMREPAGRPGPQWDPDQESPYMRTVPRIEAPAGTYGWLNSALLVGNGRRTRTGNRTDYFVLVDPTSLM